MDVSVGPSLLPDEENASYSGIGYQTSQVPPLCYICTVCICTFYQQNTLYELLERIYGTVYQAHEYILRVCTAVVLLL